MLSGTIEQNFDEVKVTWINCIDNIFHDEGLHVNDVTLKKLEYASGSLAKTTDGNMKILQELISELRLTIKEYVSGLIGSQISILIDFQEFLSRFKDNILIFFNISDQLVTEISKAVGDSFYHNLTLKYDIILKHIINELMTFTSEEIEHTLQFYTTTLFKTMRYKDIEVHNIRRIIFESLESVVKQILKESERSSNFIEFIMKFQIMVNLIVENFDIKDRKILPLMQMRFGSDIENSLKSLLELQNDKKLKTATLESINNCCKMAKLSDDRFVSLLLKYRSIKYTKDNWNALLNRIDLLDTFEESQMKRLVSYHTNTNNTNYDQIQIDDDNMLNNIIHGDEVLQKYCFFANFSTNSMAVDRYKRILRENFRESVHDIRGFHEGLSKVVDSYLETVQKNYELTNNNINFDQTMYALLMLILNYTPEVKLFIAEYYAPRLLKRIMFSQSSIVDNTIKSTKFEFFLIFMLPRETRCILISLMQKSVTDIQNPVYIDSINCNFSGIFLQESNYSFNLPKSDPIFPNKKFKDTWYTNIIAVEQRQRTMKFDQNMHIIEMTSPFLGACNEPVKLILPMNAASILYCFNESNTQGIHEIEVKLNITKNQETQLVRSLKFLIKYGLISKKGPFFTLRSTTIPSELLDENNILRLI